jgi:hypothetical protein
MPVVVAEQPLLELPGTGGPSKQRWASTLANRSNARHRSNIRAPPRPPPRCKYSKCGNLCGQRGRKRFIASWGLRMSHICPCTPCPSPPGYRSKVESRQFAHRCFQAFTRARGMLPLPLSPPTRPGRTPFSASSLRPLAALRIRIRMFLGLPDPDPIVRGTAPDPEVDPDPPIMKQK